MKMGKKTAIGIIAFITLLMINTKVEAAQVKITTDTLKLRKEPTTSSSVLDLLSMDEKFELLEDNGDWCKISARGKEGFVKKEYVEIEGETTKKETVDSKKEEDKKEDKKEESKEETKNDNVKEEVDEKEIISVGKKKIKEDTELKVLPLFSSITIDNLKKNDEVDFVTQKNNWAYVQTETQSGWILVRTIENIESKEETHTENIKEENTKTGYINAKNVNFREKNSTSSKVIKRLKINTEVRILEEDGEWTKILVDDSEGYVSNKYVSNAKVKEVTSRNLDKPRNEERIKEETENLSKKEEPQEEVKEEKPNEQKTSDKEGNKGEKVVELARKYLGNKYIYAAEGPKNFDCSGFTRYIYRQFGVSLPHSAAAQINKGKKISRGNLKLGDAVFFQDKARTKVGHVGIYIGNGNFIHSSSAVGKVTITSMSKDYYNTRFSGARRYVD